MGDDLIIILIIIFLLLLIFAVLFYSCDLEPIGHILVVCAAAVVIFGMYWYSYTETDEMHTDTTVLWYTDAPFGTYWTEINGGGSFIVFSIGSNAQESYTVKWITIDETGDEIVNSETYSVDDVTVHLTKDNSSIRLEKVYEVWKNHNGDTSYMYCENHLYVPSPELYGYSIDSYFESRYEDSIP